MSDPHLSSSENAASAVPAPAPAESVPQQAARDSSPAPAGGTGPGSRLAGRFLIGAILIVFIAAAVVDLYALMKIWPHPTPSGEAATPTRASGDSNPARRALAAPPPQPTRVGNKGDSTRSARDSFWLRDSILLGNVAISGTSAGGLRLACDSTLRSRSFAIAASDSMRDPDCVSIAGRAFPLWAEQRLLLIVVLAGMLGGLVHAIRSLGWYVGNRWLVVSWVPYYFLIPLTGALIAVAFYLVIRGGFFSPSGSFRDTSPFGFAAMAVLVGMFSTSAALKLQQLAETMFTKPGPGAEAKPQGSGKPSGGDTSDHASNTSR
jgi:hypothetical protein